MYTLQHSLVGMLKKIYCLVYCSNSWGFYTIQPIQNEAARGAYLEDLVSTFVYFSLYFFNRLPLYVATHFLYLRDLDESVVYYYYCIIVIVSEHLSHATYMRGATLNRVIKDPQLSCAALDLLCCCWQTHSKSICEISHHSSCTHF
ncbi:hypothetical protein KP509_16G064200 [Ceratopteris richardii]|uniref:Uncharacterized protein n=1 Tax=Ceratopteris richardii TaxID=49495 RepID=A0A8T2T548_CERRI|nr:hypothetical protein KP509_16G064200 [Ceratopteris richardii]